MELADAAGDRGRVEGAKVMKLDSAPLVTDSSPDLDLLELGSVNARGAYSAATARIIAYWTDECARDLDRLMTHFTSDAEVVTPDGTFRGRKAVASLYRKSFDSFPGLKVDVRASFVGRGTHCYEYSAVLSDTAHNQWLVEGVNVMKLEDGLICNLRSFEDPLRPLSIGGESE